MKKCKLGDYCLNITDGEHGTVVDDTNGDYYLLSNKNIIDNKIVISNADRKINEETFNKINKRTKLDKNDVLISTVGTIGKTVVLSEKPNFVVQRSVGIIKPNTDLLNPYYLKYKLDTPHYQKILDLISKGAVQKCIFISDLFSLKFEVPEVNYQNKIVSILKLIDDKIENNNKINEELESMAKTIYDYWFLQFEFPNEEGKPYKSSGGKMVWNEELKREIPEGWEVGYFKDVINELECGNRPKGGIIDSIDDGIPSIGAENIISIGKYDFSSEKYIPQEYFNSLKKGIVKSNDVLIYKDGAGVGSVSMAKNNFPHEKCAVNSHVFIVRSKDNNLYQNYIYLTLEKDYIKKILVNLAMKAAQPGLNQSNIESIPIIIPTKNIIKEFNKSIDIVFNRIFLNANESKELASLRDFLLPLLMNGHISFKQLALAED